MQAPAADAMRAALDTIEIRMPNAVFISNKTADAMTKPEDIKEEL
jgi:acyl transferase domain-containing protein